MQIKLNKKNYEKINSILKKVNGYATKHTFLDAREIEEKLEQADEKLKFLKKKNKIYTKVVLTSGDPVAESYNYHRSATRVEAEYNHTGWTIKDIYSTSVGVKGGFTHIKLTPAAKENIIEHYTTV